MSNENFNLFVKRRGLLNRFFKSKFFYFTGKPAGAHFAQRDACKCEQDGFDPEEETPKEQEGRLLACFIHFLMKLHYRMARNSYHREL
jgi:hypothetical protein